MNVPRQTCVLGLVFGLTFVLASCSSINPSPTATPSGSRNLELASCIEVGIEAPKVISEGNGLNAILKVKNICETEIELPLTKATSFSEGKDTGVETSFALSISDFQEAVTADDSTVSGGHLIRWLSGDEGYEYDDTMKTVILAPNEELEREFSWSGHLGNGSTLEVGKYLIAASFDLVPAGVTHWRALLPDRTWEIKTRFGVQTLDIVAD